MRVPSPVDSDEKKYINCLTDDDICCGRGKGYLSHPGNMNFQKEILENLERYLDTSTKNEKSQVVQSIVTKLNMKGSRFVKRDSATGRWFDIGKSLAHEKTGHAIRDYIAHRTRKVQSFSNEAIHDSITAPSSKRVRRTKKKGGAKKASKKIKHRLPERKIRRVVSASSTTSSNSSLQQVTPEQKSSSNLSFGRFHEPSNHQDFDFLGVKRQSLLFNKEDGLSVGDNDFETGSTRNSLVFMEDPFRNTTSFLEGLFQDDDNIAAKKKRASLSPQEILEACALLTSTDEDAEEAHQPQQDQQDDLVHRFQQPSQGNHSNVAPLAHTSLTLLPEDWL